MISLASTWSRMTVSLRGLMPTGSLSAGCFHSACLSQFALASTLYLVASAVLSGFVRRPAHSRGMWLSGVSNYLLASTFFKAVVNTLL